MYKNIHILVAWCYNSSACLMLKTLSLDVQRYDMLLLQKCDEAPHSSPSCWWNFFEMLKC
jgi:hypothetical protein